MQVQFFGKVDVFPKYNIPFTLPVTSRISRWELTNLVHFNYDFSYNMIGDNLAMPRISKTFTNRAKFQQIAYVIKDQKFQKHIYVIQPGKEIFSVPCFIYLKIVVLKLVEVVLMTKERH